MKVAIYKDTLANNRGADIAVRNLAAGLSERGHGVTLFERTELRGKAHGGYDVMVAAGTNELLDLAEMDALAPIVLQFHTDPAYQFRHWIRKWRRNRAIEAAMRKCAAIQVLRDEHVPLVTRIAPGVPVSVIGNWSEYGTEETDAPSAAHYTEMRPQESASATAAGGTQFIASTSVATSCDPPVQHTTTRASSLRIVAPSNIESTSSTLLHGHSTNNQITKCNRKSQIEKSQITLPPTIIYPAAINKDKNQRLLVEAFRSIADDFPEWEVHLYGKGKPRFRPHPRVRLMGFADLEKPFAECAFIAFPSKTEGFPLAVADAAAFGKPAVTIRDWIGTCAAGGGIVTAPTVRAFAAGLRTMMRDASLRRRMGEAARAYCSQRHSRTKILDLWETLLKGVQGRVSTFSTLLHGHFFRGAVAGA